jgi:hypothetical protein
VISSRKITYSSLNGYQNGEIVIAWDEEDYPDNRVFVTADQVVQLIEWLREALDELRGESKQPS